MTDKQTWKIGTGCDKTEKLIKFNMPVQYHKKLKKDKNFLN